VNWIAEKSAAQMSLNSVNFTFFFRTKATKEAKANKSFLEQKLQKG
jgi:hypothetical protein